MRSYPRNSPEAAARIVALMLIADGHVCRREVDAVDDARLQAALGLAPGRFGAVIQGLCEDLLMADPTGSGGLASLDGELVQSLLAEIDAPALQQTVLALAHEAAEADRHLAEAEVRLLALAGARWGVTAAPGVAVAA